jgi:hypothetical protein
MDRRMRIAYQLLMLVGLWHMARRCEGVSGFAASEFFGLEDD